MRGQGLFGTGILGISGSATVAACTNTLVDNRQDQGGLQFAFVATFPIPSGDARCQPPYNGYGYVSSCTLEFMLATLDTLKPDAECTTGGTTWTGHLVPQGG